MIGAWDVDAGTGPIQVFTAGSLVIQGGGGGAYNEAALFAQNAGQRVTISGTGGVLVQGGAGTGNYASIYANGAQEVNFGAGDLQILGGRGGGRSYAVLSAVGSQTVSGSGSIVIKGGVLPTNGTPAKFYDPRTRQRM